jgi:HK97 family phage prohead protease
MKNRREIRARQNIQFRHVTDAEKAAGFIGALEGEIPFNTDSGKIFDRSLNRGKPFIEQVAADAFKRSIAEDKDIMGFAGHTDDPLSAFARIGENLTIITDDKSMRWRALLPDTQASRDLQNLVEKKIIRGTSFEFALEGEDAERWEKRGSDDIRVITRARLFAVNPVAWPAYLDTDLTVSVRSSVPERSRRGYYLYTDEDYAYSDAAMTADVAYALESIGYEMGELCGANDYLRRNAAGALAEYARAQLAESSEALKQLIDFVTASGATVNPEFLTRAKEKLSETREQSQPNEAADRERRSLEALTIPPVSPLDLITKA